MSGSSKVLWKPRKIYIDASSNRKSVCLCRLQGNCTGSHQLTKCFNELICP